MAVREHIAALFSAVVRFTVGTGVFTIEDTDFVVVSTVTVHEIAIGDVEL